MDDDVDEVRAAVDVDSDGRSMSARQVALLDEVNKWNSKISEIGGREEYQRASQLNTDLFSTSKWVLGVMGRWGWLDGLKVSSDIGSSSHCRRLESDMKTDSAEENRRKRGKKEKLQRRDVRLLEVGAINTQLLDAAARKRTTKDHGTSGGENAIKSVRTERVYRLDVRAIDIRSTDPRIQQMDFFDLPLPDPNQTICTMADDAASSSRQAYDAIVNSMVINCVTTPAERGRMLSLCYRHLRPGGVCFLTLPKLCLIQSKFTSRPYFEEILTKGVGFEILGEVGRESPKLAFFVLRRPKGGEDGSDDGIRSWDDKFARAPVIRRGKKFRNTFAVTLNKEDVTG